MMPIVYHAARIAAQRAVPHISSAYQAYKHQKCVATGFRAYSLSQPLSRAFAANERLMEKMPEILGATGLVSGVVGGIGLAHHEALEKRASLPQEVALSVVCASAGAFVGGFVGAVLGMMAAQVPVLSTAVIVSAIAAPVLLRNSEKEEKPPQK